MLKETLHNILPTQLDERLRSISYQYRISRAQASHKIAVKKIRKKGAAKVAFFLYLEAEWKFEMLYRFMEKDDVFEPIIIIIPHMSYGEENMLREMRQAFDYFDSKGYKVVKSLDEATGKWLNVKSEINPDIVFLMNPWGSSRSDYQIENFKDTLTCYVQYTFVISYLYEAYFNKPVHNLAWKYFVETSIHKKISKQYSRNKGINTLHTGYPGMDHLLLYDQNSKDVWKIKDRKIKRIIWSPHHTISGMGGTLDYSTFLEYCDFMFDIAMKYRDRIQISFKPHPNLRNKLSMPEVWGKDKTNRYYEKWADLPNGQLNEGEYVDLFSTSDGMINDSSAFVVEYLYSQKPELFLAHDKTVLDRFNEVGKMALSHHYIGKSKEDIERFIKKVIIDGEDSMKKKRLEFFDSIIKPPNNTTASRNIFDFLKSELFFN